MSDHTKLTPAEIEYIREAAKRQGRRRNDYRKPDLQDFAECLRRMAR